MEEKKIYVSRDFAPVKAKGVELDEKKVTKGICAFSRPTFTASQPFSVFLFRI